MPSTSLPQKIAEISEELEALRFQSLRHPKKAVEMFQDGLEQLKSSLRELTELVGEMTEAERTGEALRESDGEIAWAVATHKDISDQCIAEKALRDSEAKFRALFENSIDAILLTSPNGIIEAANPAACQMFGMTEEEIIQAGRSGIVDTNDPRVKRAIKERAHTGRFRGEVNHKSKDGTIFPGEVSTALFTDKNGQVKTVITIRDITEREQAEEALRQSEERLALAISAGRLATWDRLMTTDEVVWNDEHFRMMGHEPGEVKPSYQAWIERVHPDDRSKAEAAFARSLEVGGDFSTEFRALWPDGTVRWIETRGHLDLDAKGQPHRSFGVMIDITERKEAEEALRVSEERLQRMSHAGHIGLYERNTDRNQTFCSTKAYELFGSDPGSLDTNEQLLEIVHPEDREKISYAIINASDAAHKMDGVTQQTEFRVVHPDGKVLWLETTSTFSIEGGELINRGSVRDITERKLMEEALSKNERKYRSIIEQTNDGIVLVDEAGCIVEWNTGAEKITGLNKEDVLGKPVWEAQLSLASDELKTADLETALKKMTIDMLTTGTSPLLNRPGEHAIWRPDGIRIVVEESLSIIPTERGFMISSALRDITERKRLEKRLQNSYEDINALMNSTQDIVLIIDSEGAILQINNFAAKALKGEPNNLQGKKAQELLPISTGAERMSHLSKALMSRRSYHFEDVNNGRYFSHSLYPVLDSSGEVDRIIIVAREITERKRMEAELRRSKEELEQRVQERTSELIKANLALSRSDERFRVALKNSPIFVFNQDKDLRYTWAYNPSPGVILDLILGKTDEELLLPEDIVELTKIKRRVLKSGFGERSEVRTTINGKEFFYDITVEPLLNPAGEIEGITCASIDITERKNVEKELLQSEERFRSIFTSNVVALAIWDVRGYLLDANDMFLELIGYTRAEFQGGQVRWDEVTPPEMRQRDYDAVKDLREDRIVQPYEKEFLRPDGTRVPILIGGSMLPGMPDIGVVFAVDITERKKAEEALAAAHRQTQCIIDNAPAIIYAFNLEERFVMANATVAKLLNSTPEQLIGKKRYEFMPKEDADWHEANDRQVIEAGRAIEFEEYSQIKDRSITWLTTKFPLRDAQGKIYAVAGISADITERKQAEKELIKAKEAAEEAVEVKSAFMANMSHELRTPMNAVLGFTNILLDEDLSEEQKDYLERIRNSGQALLVLINEVLNFSKMDIGMMDLELQSFDLRNITEEALDMVAAEAADKGLELIYSFDKNVPEAIIGDPGKLRQVLSNLLSNAVKFTKEGYVEVFVSFDIDEDKVHFEVRDMGIGISHEDIGKLFQPFSQLDMTFSRGYEGMGMGLAICKKLVDLMEGRIWIESEAGIGSTFQFTIPADTAPYENKPFLVGGFKNKRALIIGGSHILHRILDCQLRDWNIAPKVASSMQEAVDLLQRDNDFQIAIIDISRDDTVPITAESLNIWKKLPFIAFIAPGQKVLPHLFQAVLVKPLKPVKLFRALEIVLEKRMISEPIEIPETEKGYGPLRILLAEDNLSNQRVTLKMLEKLGYRADAVVNGQEVLEALERQPYDVIFMDVKMPVMNGIEATRKIRERWSDNGPKIIAITAYALHGDKEKCLAAGMDGYIVKPVQKEDLTRVLEEINRL